MPATATTRSIAPVRQSETAAVAGVARSLYVASALLPAV